MKKMNTPKLKARAENHDGSRRRSMRNGVKDDLLKTLENSEEEEEEEAESDKEKENMNDSDVKIEQIEHDELEPASEELPVNDAEAEELGKYECGHCRLSYESGLKLSN